jgi:hypothetical protein
LRFFVCSLALVWFDDGSVVEMEIKQSEKEAVACCSTVDVCFGKYSASTAHIL